MMFETTGHATGHATDPTGAPAGAGHTAGAGHHGSRPAARTPRARRRAGVAASGLAALALALGACGSEDSAEDVVADATSAVASAATEATSAVGSAAAEATSAVGSAVDDADRDGHGDDHAEEDQAYLDEVRAGGVDVRDDEDFVIRGHDACRDLEDGESADVVIAKYYEAHPEAGETEGETVVTAAVNAFCPDYAPALN